MEFKKNYRFLRAFLLDIMVKALYRLGMETKEDLVKDTIRKFLRISKMYSRIEKIPIPVDTGVNVTTREAHTIQAIGENEQIGVTQLAAYFGISKSATPQMVTKLIKKGFLDKNQSPHNNKEFPLSLTQLGWRAFYAHERSHGEDFAELVNSLNSFSLSQIATISVLLEAMGSIMQKRLLDQLNK